MTQLVLRLATAEKITRVNFLLTRGCSRGQVKQKKRLQCLRLEVKDGEGAYTKRDTLVPRTKPTDTQTDMPEN
jgi:hypothetical protein